MLENDSCNFRWICALTFTILLFLGSNGAPRSTKRKLDEAIKVETSSSDESDSEEEENNEIGNVLKGHFTTFAFKLQFLCLIA